MKKSIKIFTCLCIVAYFMTNEKAIAQESKLEIKNLVVNSNNLSKKNKAITDKLMKKMANRTASIKPKNITIENGLPKNHPFYKKIKRRMSNNERVVTIENANQEIQLKLKTLLTKNVSIPNE